MSGGVVASGLTFLAVLTLSGVALASIVARRFGVLSVPTAMLSMYLVVVPISGIIHLLNIPGATRGFFDLLTSDMESAGSRLGAACFMSGIGLVGLFTGILLLPRGVPPAKAEALETATSGRWLFRAGLLGVPAFWGLNQAIALRDQIDSTRVWGFDGGNARIAFLASWAPWSLVFAAAGLNMKLRRPGHKVLLLAATTVAIYFASNWSGGRSLVVLYVCPLVVIFWQDLKQWRPVVVVLSIASALYVLIEGTLARTRTYAVQQVNIPGLLDWEWGRFSMNGFAAQYTSEHGWLYGSTYVRAALSVPQAVFGFVGIDFSVPLQTASQVTANSILRSPALNYTVPGAVAESYMNFGYVGVFVVTVLLGVAASWLDGRARRQESLDSMLLLNFLIALLIFRGLVAESFSLPSYILFTGLPLLLLRGRMLLSKVGTRSILPRTVRRVESRGALKAHKGSSNA